LCKIENGNKKIKKTIASTIFETKNPNILPIQFHKNEKTLANGGIRATKNPKTAAM
jgi:hypothetical protein